MSEDTGEYELQLSVDCFDSQKPRIYIQDLIEFNYDTEKKEGSFKFDGYWYVNEQELEKHPFTYTMCYSKVSYPPRVEKLEGGGERHHYKYYEYIEFEAELYKQEKIKNTNEYSSIDDDGEAMEVCFFPTDIQQIWFRVKEEKFRIENEEPKEITKKE